ncbi:CIC11C00000003103 [Sungouiella intermedia]|uniref:CIC11C00000003103 n=1 Tax=Sungouiella intermedia TaxID=45354 RepID=A0A1L0BV06_9ASCO|nr:CIC11C00000005458 [[Candida] intermedia]SGZ55169.1 CIC11C00000003103 [[Candida] intermedia]
MSEVTKPFRRNTPAWVMHLALLPVVGPLFWFLGLVLSTILPTRNDNIAPQKLKKKLVEQPECAGLFPSMDTASALPHEPFTVSKSSTSQAPQPCSTGLTTRLLPFKNSNGEIEWAFTDELPPGSELDAFKSAEVMNLKLDKSNDILSPVTSNSSNNDSLISNKKLVSVSTLPQVNTPSSTSSEDDKNKDEDAEGDDGTGVHQCPHCLSRFKMRGYLTRHLKKHAAEKAYQCPFHKSSIYKDENDITHKCHPSGGFSRRDTYKTHLKSRHFRYPKGTSIKSRNLSPGNCSMCGEWFENGEIWCEIHIEGGECKYLPLGFKGKSRIKNRLKKQMNRMIKEQRQKLKAGTSGSVVTGDYQLPSLNTPNSVNTPIHGSNSYEYNHSPTMSVGSPIGPHQIPQQSLQESVYKQQAMLLHQVMQPEFALPADDDYDDDFCLDTDQLGAFAFQQPLPVFSEMAPSLGGFNSYPKQVVPQYN